MWPVGSVKVFYIYIYIYNVYFMSTPLPSPVLSHLDDWLTINSDNVITIHSSEVLQAPGVQVILSSFSHLTPDLAPELLNGR